LSALTLTWSDRAIFKVMTGSRRLAARTDAAIPWHRKDFVFAGRWFANNRSVIFVVAVLPHRPHQLASR
jgi:hypothetical protein